MCKMKKVMVFFLLLLVASMGFAEEKSLKVTLEIEAIPVGLAFTEDAYTKPGEALTQMPDVDFGEGITEIPDSDTPSKSFWASAKTNSANPLKIQVCGTALTRDAGNSSYETIPLALSISKGDGADNSSKQTTESPVTLDVVYNSSMSWSTADLGVILVEGATSNSDSTGAAGTGTRALTWNLTITPTLAADQPQPTAGTYVGCLWLVVDSGGTGA